MAGPRRVERIGIYPSDGVRWWDKYLGTFRIVYEKRPPPPQPGSMEYVYMSFGLPPLPIIGRAVAANWHPSPVQPAQVWANQSQQLVGVPTVAGQIVGQPLYDPDTNKVG